MYDLTHDELGHSLADVFEVPADQRECLIQFARNINTAFLQAPAVPTPATAQPD